VRPAETLDEIRPRLIADNRDGAPAIVAGTRIHAVRHREVGGVATLRGRPAGARAFEVELTDQVCRRFRLRHVDELPRAAAPPVFERGEDRHGAELARDVIRMIECHTGRVGRVRVIPQPVDAGER